MRIPGVGLDDALVNVDERETFDEGDSVMVSYDLRKPLTLTLSSEVVFHFILSIKGVYYPTL